MTFYGEVTMRTLSTLPTLLLGRAFAFLASPAKADCPHNNKTIHPHCNTVEPPPPGPPNFVIGRMGFWTPPTDENRVIRKAEAENLSNDGAIWATSPGKPSHLGYIGFDNWKLH